MTEHYSTLRTTALYTVYFCVYYCILVVNYLTCFRLLPWPAAGHPSRRGLEPLVLQQPLRT